MIECLMRDRCHSVFSDIAAIFPFRVSFRLGSFCRISRSFEIDDMKLLLIANSNLIDLAVETAELD